MQATPSSLTCYTLRLTPGQELSSTLVQFAREKKLKAAFILTCCGSVQRATLRMAKVHGKEERVITFKEYFEILSLTGTVSGDRGHLHVSLGDKDGNVVGGHVIGDMLVFTTAEVVLGECNGVAYERIYDEKTKVDELVVEDA